MPRPAAVPPDVLAAAVREVLRRDSDGDGVPDILERPAPPATPFAGAARPRVPPAGNSGLVWVGAGAAIAMCAGVVFFSTARAPRSRALTPPPIPTPTMTIPSVTANSPPPPPAPLPSVTASATTTPAKPAVKMTNEQYGKSRVAAVQRDLLSCVEQDLARNPAVPKAYSVTVFVEKDGSPLNSSTTFSPTPTSGFKQCAKLKIFYAFDRNPPNPGEFTFTTSFAFPNAKPAAKLEHGLGWDE